MIIRKIIVIIGSGSDNSTSHSIFNFLSDLSNERFSYEVFDKLKSLPHFDPEKSTHNPPVEIKNLHEIIRSADGVIFITPEYIFSIPSGLKNLLEWTVATTVFTNKPTGIITASANGEKAHAELQLIMNTLMAKFTTFTTLLIQGAKGKSSKSGSIIDPTTKQDLIDFIHSYEHLVLEASN